MIHSSTIRDARPSDAFEIARIHVASWQVGYRDLLPHEYLDTLNIGPRAERWTKTLALSDTGVLVSEDAAGALEGFVSFGASRDDNADKASVGEVYAIYIDPLLYRAGRGSTLFDAALASLRERGFVEATVWTLASNDRARSFYTKHGLSCDEGFEEVDIAGTRRAQVRYRAL